MNTQIDNPVDVVRRRLQKWEDYHSHRSNSLPYIAYSNAQRAADRIYYSALSKTSTNNNPQPKLNLIVSDEDIKLILHQLTLEQTKEMLR